MMELATMGIAKKDKNVKMYLSSVNIDVADGGGFIVRCSMEGRPRNPDEPGVYESKTKVFLKANDVAEFVSEAIMEYETVEDMED